MTCSHFCSNNYCLIDVDVLTKPTVLWIFIDLFNFWSLLHIIGRWYLEVYIDVRYGLSLYSDSFNKLEIILLFFCQETVFVIYREKCEYIERVVHGVFYFTENVWAASHTRVLHRIQQVFQCGLVSARVSCFLCAYTMYCALLGHKFAYIVLC